MTDYTHIIEEFQKLSRSARFSLIQQLYADFYNIPLKKALRLLSKKGLTYDQISEQVFNGELSKQAIQHTYIEEKI